MQFGLYSSIANPPRGENLDRSIDEVIAEAQLAEACGFDSCFFGEHHQDKDGFLPSPLIVATAVAAHTRHLRVGTSVILLPLHHPVRVAEDAITVDLVSKGRLIIGVGRTAGMLVNAANVERYTKMGVRAVMTSFFPWIQAGLKDLTERAAAGTRA